MGKTSMSQREALCRPFHAQGLSPVSAAVLRTSASRLHELVAHGANASHRARFAHVGLRASLPRMLFCAAGLRGPPRS